jgi:hypothetical protein
MRKRGTIVWVLACACGAPAKQQPTTPSPQNEIVAIKDEICRCKDVACVDAVSKQYSRSRSDDDKSKAPTDEEMAAVKQMTTCIQTLVEADRRPTLRLNGTGVAECDEVIAAYERLYECDVFQNDMPAAAQDATRKGLETLKSSWRFDDDAAKDTTRARCIAALDGIQQSAKAMGCPL